MQREEKTAAVAHRGAVCVRFTYKWVWCLLVGLVALPGNAGAILIRYQAAEINPGANTWQYAYQVSGFDFLSGDSFLIDFGAQLYSNLQDPPAVPNADWFTLTIPPSPPLWPGEYAASALIDAPSLADLFTVSFTWLGGAQRQPGVQTFTVYDPAFNVITVSETSLLTSPPPPNPMPLPGTAWLSGIGLASLLVHMKKTFPQMLNSAGPSSS